MGYYVAGLKPTDKTGEELPGVHDAGSWWNVLNLLHSTFPTALRVEGWADLLSNSGGQMPSEATAELATRLEQMVVAAARDTMPGLSSVREYLTDVLIPFLRHCGGFEVR